PRLALPPERMREALHAEYRLQPDRRCLAAVAEVQAWFGGRDALPVSATLAGSAWRIEIAGEGVGTLPELPDFGDCMTALEKWARVVGKGKGAAHGGRGASAPRTPRLNPADLLADLRAADVRASHGADPVRAFVLHDDRALVALAEGSRDELGALLVLVRRAEEHDYPGWLAWVQAHFVERPFSLPVLKSALELNAFLPNRVFPEVMPY